MKLMQKKHTNERIYINCVKKTYVSMYYENNFGTSNQNNKPTVGQTHSCESSRKVLIHTEDQ